MLGSPQIHRADIWIIAASNANLEELMRRGLFREDLYYRLNALTLTLPPLRKRPEDIPLLVRHFLDQSAASAGKSRKELSSVALEKLMHHAWPGNVREIQNLIDRAVVLSTQRLIGMDEVRFASSARPSLPRTYKAAKAEALRQWHLEELPHRLAAAGGNISKAAREGGQHPRALRALIRKYNIQPTAQCKPSAASTIKSINAQ